MVSSEIECVFFAEIMLFRFWNLVFITKLKTICFFQVTSLCIYFIANVYYYFFLLVPSPHILEWEKGEHSYRSLDELVDAVSEIDHPRLVLGEVQNFDAMVLCLMPAALNMP